MDIELTRNDEVHASTSSLEIRRTRGTTLHLPRFTGEYMQRLFLHVRIEGALHEDHDRQEFPSLASARTEAVLAARELMSDRMRFGTAVRDGSIEVVDEGNCLLLSLSFVEAISLSVG